MHVLAALLQYNGQTILSGTQRWYNSTPLSRRSINIRVTAVSAFARVCVCMCMYVHVYILRGTEPDSV